MKNPPFFFACGEIANYTNGGTVRYSSLSYASTNVEDAGLYKGSGVFTAGHPGTLEHARLR